MEHEFFIHVSPNGSYQVKYSAHGDKMDLQDHDFPIPTGNKWNIHSTLEEVEAESYDYTAYRLFKRNEDFPETKNLEVLWKDYPEFLGYRFVHEHPTHEHANFNTSELLLELEL